MPRMALKAYLDRLEQVYDRRFLDSDPVSLVHRYAEGEDREIAGLVASSLAYGNVPAIQASVGDALRRLGPTPARALDVLEGPELRRLFKGFKHRFTSGNDLAALLWITACMRRSRGSVGAFFHEGYRPDDSTLRKAMISFVERGLAFDLRAFYRRGLQRGEGVRFLLPSPAEGSACKRLNLYLRWMVRPADGVDLGVWADIPPRKLLVPVDTHVARISAYIGLTRRKTPDWGMAEEITDSLRRLDPEDPVRYDFALSRLGILDACPRRRNPVKCAECPLEPVCLL